MIAPLRRLTGLGILIAATASTLSAAPIQPRPDPFDSVRASVRRVMAERKIPSVAIAAMRDGRIVWEEGFGWADQERKVAATPTTMYSLASISKPVTGTGLMLLVQQGKVNLDVPANDYLEDAPLTAREGRAADATVRRVANHTSGLPLHYQFFYHDRPPARPSMDDAIRHYGFLAAPPGTQFTYSNLGYGVLERIIERVSGRPYDAFLRDEVFTPLGLSRMAVVTGPITGDSVATRYDAERNPIPWYDFDHRGASAVYASARDLARYGNYHLGLVAQGQRQILTPETRAAMLRPTSRRFETVGYGVGWQTFEDDYGHLAQGHSGGMPGVATSLRIYPESNVVVVVLINAGEGTTAARLASEVAASLMPRYAERLRAARPDSTTTPRFTPGAELAGRWSGAITTWQGTVPISLTIDADGAARAAIGTGPPANVERVRLQNGRLTGTVAATVPTPDASRISHNVMLDLRFHDGTLSGWVSAMAPDVFALSSYAALKRDSR